MHSNHTVHRPTFICESPRQVYTARNDVGPLSQKQTIPPVAILRNLPIRKEPSLNDIICARGRGYWDHPGNKMYRQCIDLAKTQYCRAPNRLGKSLIVSEIIDAIHNSGRGFFKKVHGKENEWVECNESSIREKVTQSLRDGLSFKYSSSITRKREKKARVQEAFYGDIDVIVHSNKAVSQKIKDLEKKVEWANRNYGIENDARVSDEAIMKIFDEGNLNILETMKKDRSILDQLHQIGRKKTKSHIHRVSLPLSPPKMGSRESFSLEFPLPFSTANNNEPGKISPSASVDLEAVTVQQHDEYVFDSNGKMDIDLESTSTMFLDNIVHYI